MHPRALLTVSLALSCAVLLAACGGGEPDDPPQAAPPPPVSAVPQPQPRARGALALPRRVPRRHTGPADPPEIKVIRLWSEALRRSDVATASGFWGIPATVQNGTPVTRLRTAAEVRAFNGSLPCGALLVSALGARAGFTIATFKLTRRPGVECGSGIGRHARTAMRVDGGKIVEWYRLPDPDAPAGGRAPPQPAPPPGPII